MTTTSPSFTKEITFDRFTKDYTATVDGQLIGSFSTYREAEIAADEHVFNLLSDGMHIPATTLDGQCGDCGATLAATGRCEECDDRRSDHTRPAPLSCVVCGNPAPILEPHGAFCGACFEGQRLWTLWHNDACGLVAYLRLAAGHLDDLARCLALYLSRKTGTALSMDSILAMWRSLLADDEPEPPALAMRAA